MMEGVFAPISALAGLQLVAIVLALWLGYCTTLAVYRVSLHPLAKFPGPKLAALTYWYEFYFDAVLLGRYSHEIVRLHEIYGKRMPLESSSDRAREAPSTLMAIFIEDDFRALNAEILSGPIVRINPNELHCNDPEFMDVIYPSAGRKRNKSTWHVAAWGPK